MKRNPDRGVATIGILAPLAAFSAVAGCLVFAGQCLAWLKYGRWMELPIGQLLGLTPEKVEWAGVRKICEVVLDFGLAPILVLGPFFVLAGFVTVLDKLEG